MIKAFIEAVVERGHFTDQDKDTLNKAGFFAVLDDDEYSDFIASHIFQEEVPGKSDYMTFDLQLTIDWQEKSYWLNVGFNEGSGFDCAASIYAEDIESDEALLKWLDDVPTMSPQEDNKHGFALLLQHIKGHESDFLDFKTSYLPELALMTEKPLSSECQQ